VSVVYLYIDITGDEAADAANRWARSSWLIRATK